MNELLFWSDVPRLYSAVTWTLYLLLLAAAIFPVLVAARFEKTTGRGWQAAAQQPWVFLTLLWVFVFAARWPGLFYFAAFNVDEAQIMAAAQALVHDPVFFRASECGSSGPMVVYPLLVSLLVGQEPGYFSARVVGLAMLCGTATAFYGIARLVVTESVARMSTLIPVVALALTHYWDFVHYTSEHAPVFYLFAGLYCAARVALMPGLSRRSLIASAVAGAVLFSLVPFAKLQGTYLALFGGVLLLSVVFFRRDYVLKERLVLCGITIGAALVFPILLVVVFAWAGVFEYFVLSYLGNALAYQASGLADVNSWQLLGTLLGKSPDAAIYAAGLSIFTLLATAALLAPSTIRLARREIIVFTVTFLLLVLAFSAVLTTQRDYGHYLIFLPFFAALFTCVLAGALVRRADRIRPKPQDAANYQLTCVGLLALVTILPVVGLRLENPSPWAGSARTWSERAAAPHSGPGNAIYNIGRNSNARMAVWGYGPELYIEGRMRQATRLSTSSAIFNDNHLRPFFLKTYLEDLERSSPDLFVDAVAEGQFMMNDPSVHGHELVPEIAEYVKKNYELVRKVRGVRIFRRVRPPQNADTDEGAE